jgi:hypothetical protein
MNVRRLPTWAYRYTVGPQEYIRSDAAFNGTSGSAVRVSVL